MRAALLVLVAVATAVPGMALNPQVEVLETQVRVQRGLLSEQLAELERTQANAQEAWVRVQNASTDLLRAHDQGESLDSLRLRDEDLRLAEAELVMDLLEAQQLRRTLVVTRQTLEAQLAMIRRLREEVGAGEDPITGIWKVVVEPGGQNGVFELRLDGTLIQGTYSLDGGWSGSLRGTLVANKVRLERVDSQLGFAAILYGRLIERGRQVRIEGNWEATQLASGLPSAGTWIAEHVDNDRE